MAVQCAMYHWCSCVKKSIKPNNTVVGHPFHTLSLQRLKCLACVRSVYDVIHCSWSHQEAVLQRYSTVPELSTRPNSTLLLGLTDFCVVPLLGWCPLPLSKDGWSNNCLTVTVSCDSSWQWHWLSDDERVISADSDTDRDISRHWQSGKRRQWSCDSNRQGLCLELAKTELSTEWLYVQPFSPESPMLVTLLWGRPSGDDWWASGCSEMKVRLFSSEHP